MATGGEPECDADAGQIVAVDSRRPSAGRARRGAASRHGATREPGRIRGAPIDSLIARYRRHGDQAAREAVVRRFLPLARQLARRYQATKEPWDDLVQVASLGLVKAVDRFDPSRGVAFSSYAVPTILGELRRYFRDSGWAVHVPRGVQERSIRLDRVTKALSSQLGRPPSVAEIATAMGATTEEVLEAREAAMAYDAVSLDGARGSEDGEGAAFVETLGQEDRGYDLVETWTVISPTLRALPPRDRLVLYLRFVEDLTQSEIAVRVGVSQMQVSRLLRRSLARLRAVAEAA